MNATAQLTDSLDATLDCAAVPILMRLPDLREIAASVVQATSLPTEAPISTPATAAASIVTEVAPIAASPAKVVVEVIEVPVAATKVSEVDEATSTTASVATANNSTSESNEATTATTNPISRRDRAQERLRRQKVEPVPKSWWRSQAPAILIVFLIALGVTLYVARQKSRQNRPAPETWANEDTPVLDIETNTTPDTLPVIETAKPAPKQMADASKSESLSTELAPKREVKTPPLLTADVLPKSEEKTATETKVETKVEAKTEVTQATGTPTYPTTNPDDYRPGGRVAQLPEKTGAETPVNNASPYPMTQFPSTWR